MNFFLPVAFGVLVFGFLLFAHWIKVDRDKELKKMEEERNKDKGQENGDS